MSYRPLAAAIAIGLTGTLVAGVATAAGPSGSSSESVVINTHSSVTRTLPVGTTGFAVVDRCSVKSDATTSEITVKGPAKARYLVRGSAQISEHGSVQVMTNNAPLVAGPIATAATGSGFHLSTGTIGGAPGVGVTTGTLQVMTASVAFTVAYSEYVDGSDCQLDTQAIPSTVVS